MNELVSLLGNTADVEEQINSLSINTVLVASLLLIVLIGISTQVVKKKKLKALKKPLFILITLTIVFPSLLMTGSTIYLNTISDSKGPVHWHTDIEFWVCGQEIELRDPVGLLSNKIGTSTYHEHDDKRIHLEGVVVDKEFDASLGKFMTVTGGKITKDELVIPTEDSLFEDDKDGDEVTGDTELVRSFASRDDQDRTILSLANGQGCSDNGYGEVQAFLYSYNKADDTYSQRKLPDPAAYLMRDESTVPPGDCLIVEFDQVKSTTDKLCQQYGVRDSERCVSFGVSEFNPKLCNIREVAPIIDDSQTTQTQEEL